MLKLIRAATVLTGRPGESIRNGEVLVDGTRIAGVGERGSLDVPPSALVLDLPGRTLMPGLVDAHVHLGFDDRVDPVTGQTAESDPRLLLRMAENARKLVSAGVTLARDLGGRNFLDVALRDSIAAGLTVGPNLLVATRPITPTGGHCWYMGGEADDLSGVRRVARENLRAGADVLKVMASGGQMTAVAPPAWRSQFDVTQLRAIVEEAELRGKGVAAHAHSPESISDVLEAGVTTIEHCTFLTPTGYAYDADLVARIASSGVYVCPTVHGQFEAIRSRVGSAPLDGWLSMLTRMRDAGVRLVAGDDCGFHLGDLDKAADDYVGGLEVFALAGFSAAEIIELATVTAAAACGVGDETGSLDAGKRADIIAVHGDPLFDLAALREIDLVLVAGRAVTQSGVDTVAGSSGGGPDSLRSDPGGGP
ncbi:amidohydrolase family protein [Virgisporangium aurantiacum]|uniref:Amidohydrolase n=1 Tax=Virgisporangium aurantiacum TaxID=175570 RepID=A0A8J3ZKN8_9ACTN|nr:amidohydrolase family protein [Virgisporangium aurantiacum]GIJ63261.1 amidohydrolase [Virgisporangium aurantiacum]